MQGSRGDTGGENSLWARGADEGGMIFEDATERGPLPHVESAGRASWVLEAGHPRQCCPGTTRQEGAGREAGGRFRTGGHAVPVASSR